MSSTVIGRDAVGARVVAMIVAVALALVALVVLPAQSAETVTTTIQVPERVEYETGVLDVRVDVDGLPAAGRVSLSWDDSVTVMDREDLVDGAATLGFPSSTPPGVVPFEVFYVGDDGGSAHLRGTVTIEKATPEISVRSTHGSSGSWYVAYAPWDLVVTVPDLYRVDATVSVYDGSRLLDRTELANGHQDHAVLDIDAADLGRGDHRLEIRLSDSPFVADTSVWYPVRVRRHDVELTAYKYFDRTFQWGRTHKIGIVVDDSQGPGTSVAGTVAVYRGDTWLASAPVGDDREAVIRIPGKKLAVGQTRLRFVYRGNDHYAPASTYRTVRVYKARTATHAKLVDRTVHRPQRAKVKVRLTSPSDVHLTGKILLRVDGTTVKTVRLKKRHDGSRTVLLPRSIGPGPHHVKVIYLGTAKKARSAEERRYFRIY